MALQSMNRFPVKSCRGQSLQQATVEPWGLAGDRRWMVVDEDGVCVTAREHPRMLLVTAELRDDGGLELSSPDLPALSVDVPDPARTVDVKVFTIPVVGVAAAAEAHAWFSKLAGEPVRLVHLHDPTGRHPNPRLTRPTDLVSFADAYPLLAATTASLSAVNDWIAEGPLADEGPLPMTRFRPNLVIDGAGPWEEDGWRRVRIGPALFRAVKGCDRCAMTLTDPDTATKGKEPIATLARHRKWDGATWFGMQLVPDNPGVTISVGDQVEILEAVPAPDGPPR
ncbi:MAG: MOSC domain-containing protein [Jatrophihabitans sp.]|uniref:MOSC domain-containing protein n=1 Tax=Jatrophihabitans sp. TaxID=1932789 RepID=UPI0039127736